MRTLRLVTFTFLFAAGYAETVDIPLNQQFEELPADTSNTREKKLRQEEVNVTNHLDDERFASDEAINCSNFQRDFEKCGLSITQSPDDPLTLTMWYFGPSAWKYGFSDEQDTARWGAISCGYRKQTRHTGWDLSIKWPIRFPFVTVNYAWHYIPKPTAKGGFYLGPGIGLGFVINKDPFTIFPIPRVVTGYQWGADSHINQFLELEGFTIGLIRAATFKNNSGFSCTYGISF